MPKKLTKQAKEIVRSTIIMGAGAVAMGAVGGVVAVRGQQAMVNASRMMPAMGTVASSQMLVRTTKKMLPKRYRR